jgi:ethanolamine utilization protein EutN
MRIGKVIGTVTLSRSHPSLAGASYRVVVPLSLENLLGRAPATAEPLVVYDELGTGNDDVIAFTEGGEATQPFYPATKPIDAYNAALLDAIHFGTVPHKTER